MGKYKASFYALPLAMAIQAATAGNLMTDGGFESGVLSWSSTKSILALDAAAAYVGQAGMNVNSAYNWCPYGALYTLDTSKLQNGTMYEFGARIRLANSNDISANHKLGLIKNGADPVWLDGDQSSYDGGAYPDKWTRLFGVWKASVTPTDSLKVCIIGAINKPFHVDEAFVTPLTTAEIGYQPPATLDSSTLIHADGNRLVMGSQKTSFIMKGINVYQYDMADDPPAIDAFRYKNADAASYKEIRDLGFNSVRLNLAYSLFEDSTAPGVYKEEGWAVVDRHILWAKQNGLRLILDMHVPPGGYQSTTDTGFGSNATLKKRLENLWVAIAQRYRNETTIAAYDLINEPHVNNWFTYAQTVINNIRAVDPNHLIDVEVSFHPSDTGMYKLADNNILYDVHWYEPWSWAGSHTNNTPYTGTLEQFKQQLRTGEGLSNFYQAATDSFTVPFNIGEYGITFEKYELAGVNGVTWLQHSNAAFDYFGISRQLFHYNEANFGVYRSWNSYPNEHTKTTEPLKAALPSVNGTGGNTPDTTPDPFVFTDQTGVNRSTLLTSNAITISGIDAAAPITVTGGEYSINGGAYTSATGTISNSDTVQVRHTSSANYATVTNTVLTVGGISDVFSSTTLADTNDTTPAPFIFVDKTGVNLAALIESNAVTISGINSAAPIAVTGGEYSVNGGAYTSAVGTISNGDTVQVHHTSSSQSQTTVNTTLTIGGVSDTFSSKTGTTDTTPNAFSFTAKTGVPLTTPVESNTVAVSGINAPASISVASGEYRINSGAYTAAAGTVSNGDKVQVRHTSSASFSTSVTTTLTMGGISGSFKSTTLAKDTKPNSFSFTAQAVVPVSSSVESGVVTVSGINAPAGISVTSGEYRINGGAYTAAAGTVSNGDKVQVRHTSSASFSTSVTTTLMVGGISGSFKSTTLAKDTKPDSFSFTAQTGVTPSTIVESNPITVSGINTPASISVTGTGAAYSVNGGIYTSTAGTISNGSTLKVRHTSSSKALTAVSSTLTIGGVASSFKSTTR
ncbi:cellulase family glycosylhydrolase [Thiothrix fructosivorans]|uniref:Cellulase family glycosylhydrolase n=1 Tax=Thiothrix fructosivorans TaxID=111770 RepID=A0A8B0SP35_9GAMM|nr:cellulase family glycosylhydrolase [Thiothrix fructosivorans]MBO0611373.1 cellulase family glycosylhydrolase [Thiothrix fructosivorans]QTX13056.1 cellulase family glycosylhydrolase [Thiothrix fructosivorans]